MVWLMLCAGCSTWKQNPNTEPILPAMTASPESLSLEIGYVHLSAEEIVTESQIWEAINEQALAHATRHKLNSNGVRVGVVGSQMPPKLKELLERTVKETSATPSGESLNRGEDAPSLNQRVVQLSRGKRAKILLTGSYDSLSVLSRTEQDTVTGHLFEKAQCLFTVRSYAEGSGSAQIELFPEIEHGEVKNRWVPVDGALVQQIGKERKIFEDLRITCNLMAGQTMLLGSTPEACGIGQPFFTSHGQQGGRILVLIRLAHMQQDELFAPVSKGLEISTASE
jgi:hypothetical protein